MRTIPILLCLLGIAAPAAAQVPDRFAIVQAVDRQFPHLLQQNTTATAREFMWRTIAALADADPKFGFLSKSAGENGVEIPGVGRVAIDAAAYQGSDTVIDFMARAGDGPGTGGVAWQVKPRRPTNHWVQAIPFSGSTPPPPSPGLDRLAELVAHLEARINALDAAQRQQRVDIEGARTDTASLQGEVWLLKQKPPELPLEVLLEGLRKVYFECAIGRSLYHGHTCTIAEPRAK